MLKNWIKKDVLNQPPYKVKTIPYQIKLNQNESPWDWPIDIKERIGKSILASDWNRYPNLIPTQLKKKIGEINHIDNKIMEQTIDLETCTIRFADESEQAKAFNHLIWDLTQPKMGIL